MPPASISTAATVLLRASPDLLPCGTAPAPSPAPPAGMPPALPPPHTPPDSAATPAESLGPAPRPVAGGWLRHRPPGATADQSGSSAPSDHRVEFAAATARASPADSAATGPPPHSPAASPTS